MIEKHAKIERDSDKSVLRQRLLENLKVTTHYLALRSCHLVPPMWSINALHEVVMIVAVAPTPNYSEIQDT